MESRNNQPKIQRRRGNLNDPEERARILRQYGGIFPDNIVEFAEKVIRREKKQINYSR